MTEVLGLLVAAQMALDGAVARQPNGRVRVLIKARRDEVAALVSKLTPPHKKLEDGSQ